MVVGLAIGVNVPFAENLVLRLDRLAEVPAPRLMGFQIVLEPLNASGEAGWIAPGVIASALDVTLVKLGEITINPLLHLTPIGAFRVV